MARPPRWPDLAPRKSKRQRECGGSALKSGRVCNVHARGPEARVGPCSPERSVGRANECGAGADPSGRVESGGEREGFDGDTLVAAASLRRIARAVRDDYFAGAETIVDEEHVDIAGGRVGRDRGPSVRRARLVVVHHAIGEMRAVVGAGREDHVPHAEEPAGDIRDVNHAGRGGGGRCESHGKIRAARDFDGCSEGHAIVDRASQANAVLAITERGHAALEALVVPARDHDTRLAPRDYCAHARGAPRGGAVFEGCECEWRREHRIARERGGERQLGPLAHRARGGDEERIDAVRARADRERRGIAREQAMGLGEDRRSAREGDRAIVARGVAHRVSRAIGVPRDEREMRATGAVVTGVHDVDVGEVRIVDRRRARDASVGRDARDPAAPVGNHVDQRIARVRDQHRMHRARIDGDGGFGLFERPHAFTRRADRRRHECTRWKRREKRPAPRVAIDAGEARATVGAATDRLGIRKARGRCTGSRRDADVSVGASAIRVGAAALDAVAMRGIERVAGGAVGARITKTVLRAVPVGKALRG